MFKVGDWVEYIDAGSGAFTTGVLYKVKNYDLTYDLTTDNIQVSNNHNKLEWIRTWRFKPSTPYTVTTIWNHPTNTLAPSLTNPYANRKIDEFNVGMQVTYLGIDYAVVLVDLTTRFVGISKTSSDVYPAFVLNCTDKDLVIPVTRYSLPTGFVQASVSQLLSPYQEGKPLFQESQPKCECGAVFTIWKDDHMQFCPLFVAKKS